MKATDDSLWITLDFHASKKSMHQWSYLKKYNNFISEKFSKNIECWVPKYTDPEIINEIGQIIARPILRTPEYLEKESCSPIVFYLYLLVERLLKTVTKISSPVVTNCVRQLIASVFLRKVVKRLIKLGYNKRLVHIVIPTTTPIVIRMLERIPHQFRQYFVFHLGFLTGENKGIFQIVDFEKKILELSKSFKIKIGAETKSYQENLFQKFDEKLLIFWCPTPSLKNRSQKKFNAFRNESEGMKQQLKIGFLGNARPNKGFTNIPNLVAELIQNGYKYQYYIQKALYPWPSYEKSVRQIIKLAGKDANFIDSNISQKDFIDKLREMDILVLPYNFNDYKYSGSGILFDASDYGIPVVASSGVSFEWDLINYGIGSVFDSKKDFAKSIVFCKQKYASENFDTYNRARNFSCYNFLS